MTSVDSAPERSLLYRFGENCRPAIDYILAAHSQVGDPPVFDPAQFPWTADLSAGWETIAAEAAHVVRDLGAVPPLYELSPDHRGIADPDRWRSFFLWGYGYRSDENCALCPETTRLLERVPELNSAFFSILKPHAHIPRHAGVTKAILTCHLGLQTPRAGRCEMAVDDTVVKWREGECLVFDDTYEHEVWNDTDEIRIVLLIQFRRPVRQPGRFVRDLFIEAVRRSPFVQEARQNFYSWDRNLRAMDRAAGPFSPR
ncbi:MAG TPA: aspartyl/asparaginyl beta-hydroxylase domain-containing protein [Caulobacteraceae bacterium]|jgi:beta-hydroxylase|nr:aspartyl/asparaginyl beta-hydroxylase domain-containing protein [Caulobacteraceae bacterium]